MTWVTWMRMSTSANITGISEALFERSVTDSETARSQSLCVIFHAVHTIMKGSVIPIAIVHQCPPQGKCNITLVLVLTRASLPLPHHRRRYLSQRRGLFFLVSSGFLWAVYRSSILFPTSPTESLSFPWSCKERLAVFSESLTLVSVSWKINVFFFCQWCNFAIYEWLSY